MSDVETAQRGPMEQWGLDACMHVTETAGLLSWWVPWGALQEMARQQDAALARAEQRADALHAAVRAVLFAHENGGGYANAIELCRTALAFDGKGAA